MSYETVGALVAALRSKQISASEALAESIRRIESRDTVVNAVVVRDFERARKAAAQADAALARGDRQPLLGVPMTVKESFNIAGLPTTWGLPAAAQSLAQLDAVAVGRLKAAGAVVLGKTNVPVNLGDLQSVNPVYGLTRNPWNPQRTPGGSSGGAAAALAAGFVPLELGSDLGGSLRFPAHCCGVYAHKPTHGLVPTRGHAPPGTPDLSVSRDPDLAVVGPMARCAADLGLALAVLAGPDEPQSLGFRLELPPSRHSHLREFRVVLLDEHPLLPLSDEVSSALARFAADLRRLGCKVERAPAQLPDLRVITATFTKLLMSYIGSGLPDPPYHALERQAAQVQDKADPAALRLQALVASHRDWMRADRERAQLSHEWRQLFAAHDVVACPVLPTTAFPHDSSEFEARKIDIDGRPIPYAMQGVWSGLATISGLPATAIPIGIGPSGLPIGIQLIGPYLEDHTTLAFAELIERELGGFTPPPAFG